MPILHDQILMQNLQTCREELSLSLKEIIAVHYPSSEIGVFNLLVTAKGRD